MLCWMEYTKLYLVREMVLVLCSEAFQCKSPRTNEQDERAFLLTPFLLGHSYSFFPLIVSTKWPLY